MFETLLSSFLNPATMVAGAALISSPIIIHLINRMRYKRIHWAAMEFLLKAQKRVRRKMIIEQLLLLLLRILLVLLLGMLFGRFLGCSPMMGKDTRETVHVIVLDDTPSMTDRWRSDSGQETTAFQEAKRLIVEQIAPAAAEATTPQRVELLRLSDLDTPRSFSRLNVTTIDEIRGYLAGLQPTPVHIGVPEGLRRARDLLSEQGAQDVAQVIHLVSDFRSTDWSEDAEQIKDLTEEITASRIKVHLIDVVHPYRQNEKRPPLFHDNVGIVELRPSKRIVARNQPLECTLRVKNYSTTELRDVRFSIRVNGDENAGGLSVVFPTLPGQQEKTTKFTVNCNQVGSDERPLDRFNLISAVMMTPEPGGIAVDNVRHAVVEVRETLPILVVEGRPNMRDSREGDGFYLRPIFTNVLGGISWVPGTAQDLERDDLGQYSSIFILNVPSVSEEAAENLERYVREGGGVGFFLGSEVNPLDYNRLLYAEGNGLFPVSLPERPSEPLTEEQRLAKLLTFQKKVLLKDPAAKQHPALAGIYTDEQGQPIKDDLYEKFFNFVTINQYWPVRRLGEWRDDPRITELFCMPNDQPMANFEAAARRVSDMIPTDDEEFTKYQELLDSFREQIRRTAASAEPLHRLATVLDRFLSDSVSEGDESEALLREFWLNSKTAALKEEVKRLRDAVKFGDPLYIAKQYGRGRVTVVTTTAGEQWTNWPSGPGSASYVPMITEMERYLSGGGTEENHLLGEPITYRLEPERYKPNVGRAFLTHDGARESLPGADSELTPLSDLEGQEMASESGELVFRFDEAIKPGAYLFTLNNLSVNPANPSEVTEVPEYRAVAVNVDTTREGDLRRASQSDIAESAIGVAGLHSPDDADWLDTLRNKQTDLSESGWLFLIILLLLMLELYMSRRLSFHRTENETDNMAPSAAAAMHRGQKRQVGDPSTTTAA